MDLKGRYGQLSQPPPAMRTTSNASLPTAKRKSNFTPTITNSPLPPKPHPTPVIDAPSSHTLNTKPKLPYSVLPVTYDPTRPATISHPNTASTAPTPVAAAANPHTYPSLSDSDSEKKARLSRGEETDSDYSLDEDRYLQMLEQYAQMTGVSFSTSFLEQFGDSEFNSQASSARTSQDALYGEDELPYHRRRLPKGYRPNVMNPRPLMDLTDGPASPIWPPFIKDIIDAPIFRTCKSLEKEPFHPTSSQQQSDSNIPKSFSMNTLIYESNYSVLSTQPQRTTSAPQPHTPLHKQQDPHHYQDQYRIPALQFESRFECGNLGKAIRRGPSHYELHVRCDLNTAGHAQWYYFRVKGMVTRNEETYEDVVYRFDIVNMNKPKSLYSTGLKPLLYSDHLAVEKGIGWHRAGTNISYYTTPEFQCTSHEGTSSQQSAQPKYTLSFTLHFPKRDDTAYIAHCFPYTYTDLQQDIQTLKSDTHRSSLFRHTIFAKSVAGNNLDLLTVTNPVSTPQALASRRGIVLSARVHPGETNASWMMRGLMRFLTGPSVEACLLREQFVIKLVPMINPDGVIVGNYRCNLSGYDLNRQWTNTNSSRASSVIPEICAMHTLLERSTLSRPVLLYCDLHGHNRKNGIFIYGCENDVKPKATGGGNTSSGAVSGGRKVFGAAAAMAATVASTKKSRGADEKETDRTGSARKHASTTPARVTFSAKSRQQGKPAAAAPPPPPPPLPKTNSQETLVHTPSSASLSAEGTPEAIIPPKKYMERVFPWILAENAPDLFYFRRCQFRMQPSKRGTGRICVRTRFGIVNSFTMESSFCGSDVVGGGVGKLGWHYGTLELERMGEKFGKTLYDYFIVEGKRDSVHRAFVHGFANHDAVLEPEESDDSETTSDDEVLRIKPVKKKVLTKRASLVTPRAPRKPIVSPDKSRRGSSKATVVTPVARIVSKEALSLTKVKITNTHTSDVDHRSQSVSKSYAPGSSPTPPPPSQQQYILPPSAPRPPQKNTSDDIKTRSRGVPYITNIQPPPTPQQSLSRQRPNQQQQQQHQQQQQQHHANSEQHSQNHTSAASFQLPSQTPLLTIPRGEASSSAVSQPPSQLATSFKIKSLSPGMFYKPIGPQSMLSQLSRVTTAVDSAVRVGWLDEEAAASEQHARNGGGRSLGQLEQRQAESRALAMRQVQESSSGGGKVRVKAASMQRSGAASGRGSAKYREGSSIDSVVVMPKVHGM
ncbi:Cytosolic carboxypeptidase 2 [Chytriomyces hyalinus]|nr:Cytosolic carboxypeptidase 2 [Chytriomyces hyalinus]